MELRDVRALTFDVYGTLIDWESGILASLRPWAQRHRIAVDDDTLLARFGELEHRVQAEQPTLRYSELLAQVHVALARHFRAPADAQAAQAFGRSVPAWPAFADSAAALSQLKRRYRLCILSNVDNASLQGSLPKLGVAFDALFTAEDIGSYKPDERNFRHALARLGETGIGREQLLHVGQSLFHDHEPASRLGIATCWIDRRHGKRGQGAVKEPSAMPRLEHRFDDLASFAQAVERSFAVA